MIRFRIKDSYDHIPSDRIVTIELAIPLRSDTIIMIIVNDLLRASTCRCVLIRAHEEPMRFVAISYDWLKEILSDGDHDLSHDWTATGILAAPTDHCPLSFLDFFRVNIIADVQNPPPLEQALAEEVLAQGVAKPYPSPFCLWSPLVASLKKIQNYYQI